MGITVGIDLAQTVCAVHVMDEFGRTLQVRPDTPHAKPLEHLANLPAFMIDMKTCSVAHHLAREFAKFGHTVGLMAPKFVVTQAALEVWPNVG